MDNLRAGPTDPPLWALGGGEVRSSYCREGEFFFKNTMWAYFFTVYCIQDRVLMVFTALPINMKKLNKVRYYLNGNTWANPYGRLIQSTHLLFTSPCEDHFSSANLKLQTGFVFAQFCTAATVASCVGFLLRIL
jgi:hypothetical protein